MWNVTVFTLRGCSHCDILVDKLRELNIKFQDLEINKNKPVWDYIVGETGYNILPTVILQQDKSDFGVAYIPGQDFNNTEGIIEIITRHIS